SSLYAMLDYKLIDPRFSMVQRDEQGDIILDDVHLNDASAIFTENEFETLKKLRSTRKPTTNQKRLINELTEKENKLIFEVDKSYLKHFTETAKRLGITPIFDLVFNHLAKNAPFFIENEELCDPSDRTFPDATAF